MALPKNWSARDKREYKALIKNCRKLRSCSSSRGNTQKTKCASVCERIAKTTINTRRNKTTRSLGALTGKSRCRLVPNLNEEDFRLTDRKWNEFYFSCTDSETGEHEDAGRADLIRSGRSWVIDNIKIFDPHRRKYLGTRFYTSLAKWACKHGGPLVSNDRNEMTEPFWEKQYNKGRARKIKDHPDPQKITYALTCPAPTNLSGMRRKASTPHKKG